VSARVAIVGAGPAGAFTAAALRRSRGDVAIDIFERLPTAWGLLRGGVAPDHQEIKRLDDGFERDTLARGCRFLGNVEVGTDVTHAELMEHYTAVVYATGAQTDKSLGIPGEDLPGSWAATEFVAWYNGHPDFRDRAFDLSVRRAVVIGNGNVAADVTRLLTRSVAELERTDVADHALEALRASAIEEVVVLGRRGPAQAAFTNPELLELGDMTDADVFVDPGDAELDPLSKAFIESEAAHATAKKNVDILSGYAAREPLGKRRRIVLRFLVSPVEILGGERVEGIRIVHNELAQGEDGALRPRATDVAEELDCGLVFRSIGYQGTRIPGVPFDERSCTIPHDRGRILERSGEYAVGWIKRGPTGIIGTNKRDAQETVNALLEDLDAGRLPTPADSDRDSIEALLAERQPDVVSYAGWQAVDRAEREAGEPHGRPRVKLCSFEELLEAARDATPAP
jgi:ferredoxin--NADP+ reductase